MPHFAFSSNAFKKTDLFEAARQIAGAGYGGMEIMADVPHAYPPEFTLAERGRLKELLAQLNLQVSNVNAFTLFARGDTYHPTWIEADYAARQVRIEHTIDAVKLAAEFSAKSVSIQPGGPMIGAGLTFDEAAGRFAAGLNAVLPAARDLGILIAIEPEPGLLIQNVEEFERFKQQYFAADPHIAMNCDLGHLFCVGDDPLDVIQRYSHHIAHVHLEDIGKNHVHQHLPLGAGVMDIPAILNAIEGSGYDGWVTVELYPYVATAREVAREAMAYLGALRHS